MLWKFIGVKRQLINEDYDLERFKKIRMSKKTKIWVDFWNLVYKEILCALGVCIVTEIRK